MSDQSFVVYLLVGIESGFRYVGHTVELTRRVSEHNSGQDRATAPYRPYRAVILRHAKTREEARRAEKYFKSGFGRRAIDRLLEAEKKLGHHIADAEAEGVIRNPSAS